MRRTSGVGLQVKDDAHRVSKVLSGLRPAMQADGGDVELISVEAGVVSVKLQGTCTLCPSASMTLKHGVERALRAELPWVVEVIRVP